MTTKYAHSISMTRNFALASLVACLAWPAANAQTPQTGMGAMKPSMAASAPMGAGNMMGTGGMKGAGHMGTAQVTVRNLEIVEVNTEDNVLLVKGAVPGPNGGYVLVRRAKR